MFAYLKDWWKQSVFSLRFAILFIFISLFVITTLVIVTLRSVNNMNAINYISKELLDSATVQVEHRLANLLNPATRAAEFSAQLIEGDVLATNFQDLAIYTFYLLQSLKLIKGVFYGDEQANYIYTERELDNTIRIDIFNRKVTPATRVTYWYNLEGKMVNAVVSEDLSYDPRVRLWYIAAKSKGHTIWTPIFTLAEQKVRAIATAAPVFKSQQFVGAFGLDLSLGYLTRFLDAQHVSKHGFSVVLNGQEELIAYPKANPFFKNLKVPPHESVNVHGNESLKLLDMAIDEYKKTHQSPLVIRYQGDDYLVNLLPVTKPQMDDWLIGVFIPKTDFTAPLVWENYITLLISSLILILGIWLVSLLASRVVKPIKLLSNETEKIRQFELDNDIRIKSKIKEVRFLADAINSMKLGLKQFQKYVPKVLVRQLVESQQDLQIGGTRKKLVVFFSDIQNFTTIAEKMNPNMLTQQLCAYFEVVSAIIINEKGTIDKYIGDSVMAFWGAPLPTSSPCHHAARAALNCINTIDALNTAWAKVDKPGFVTRIGLHMGEAIVGNVGSSERLSYTAVGDTINVTNRLEEINKIYKTRIMVSEVVYQVLKEDFIFRLVDEVVVKGRSNAIRIYELLAEYKRDIPFDIDTYNRHFEKGFAFFQAKQWDEALAEFFQCLRIFPGDSVVPIFIQRGREAGKTAF